MEYDTSEGYSDSDFSKYVINGRERKTGGDDYLPESMHRQLYRTELPNGQLACDQSKKRGDAKRKRSLREMITTDEAIERLVDNRNKKHADCDERKKRADRALEHIRAGMLLATSGNVQIRGMATPGQIAFRVYKHEFDEFKLPNAFFRNFKLQRGRVGIPDEVSNTHVQIADTLCQFGSSSSNVVSDLIEGFCKSSSASQYLDYGECGVQTGVINIPLPKREPLKAVCRFHPFWVRDSMEFSLYVVIMYDKINPLEHHKIWEEENGPNEKGVYVDFFYHHFAKNAQINSAASSQQK